MKSTKDTIRTALQHINTGFDPTHSTERNTTMAKRGMQDALKNVRAHRAVEKAANASTSEMEPSKELPSLVDAQAALQASLDRNSSPTPTASMVPLAEQLTPAEQKMIKANKAIKPKEDQVAVVTIPAPKAGEEVDAKRQKMLETLARARAVRAQQLADGTYVAKVKSTVPPTKAPQPVQPPVDLSVAEALGRMIAEMDLMLTRMMDALERLEKVGAA